MTRYPHTVHRPTAQQVKARQRGMAVIGALVVVAAASVATAAIIERQALLADTLVGERDRAQAKWLLRGGLDWSRIILLNDARRNAVTRKDAIWAQPILGLEVGTADEHRKAYFSGQIEDEQSKFNIWSLAVGGTIQPQELATLETLLAGLNIPMSLAGTIARRVADAQPGADTEQQAPGLKTLDDLLAIEAMTPQIATTLSAYLTILPQKTTINANTASAEVLSASIPGLYLAQARELTEQRDHGQWFNSRADFFNRLGNPDIEPGNQIGVASEWFKVTGQVTLDQTAAGLQALLYRRGAQPPSIRWIID
ncbi:MAG: type II secretion system minor pseudopilin GspK [Pusillimonas sp.]